MRKWLAVGIVVLVVAAIWAITSSRSNPLEGGVVLTELKCEQDGNDAVVSGRATNQTNQRLSGVTVEYAAGSGDTRVVAQEEVSTFQRGGMLGLHHRFVSTGEIDSCFIKFFRDGTQLPAAFRP